MNFQESLLSLFLGTIWQASCCILAVFCVGERKSTSKFTSLGRKWIGVCTTWSTKWTHKGILMLYHSASPSQTSKGMSTGTRKINKKMFLVQINMRQVDQWLKKPISMVKCCKHQSLQIRSSSYYYFWTSQRICYYISFS